MKGAVKGLRWGYLAGMMAFPWAVWWGSRVWGHPVAAWTLPGIPHPMGLFILWGIVWDLIALAPLLELRGPMTSWREEVAQWVLYAMFAVTVSGLFVIWAWGAFLLLHLVLRSLPFLETLGGLIYSVLFLALMASTWAVISWLEKYGLVTAIRTVLRASVLRLDTHDEELLRLLEEMPLSSEEKAYYRVRLQERGGASMAVLRELLDAVEALPQPQTFRQQTIRLRMMQALRNRLAAEEFRQWN